MPTAKGQALADEYGIKFFETVSSNMAIEYLKWKRKKQEIRKKYKHASKIPLLFEIMYSYWKFMLSTEC